MEPDKKVGAVIGIGMENIKDPHRDKTEEKIKIAPFTGGPVFPVNHIGYYN